MDITCLDSKIISISWFIILLAFPFIDRIIVMYEYWSKFLAYWQSQKVNVNENLIDQLQTQNGGILTSDEATCVRREPDNARKKKQLINIVIKKGEKQFNNFCTILELDDNNIKACAEKVEAPEHRRQAEECTEGNVL